MSSQFSAGQRGAMVLLPACLQDVRGHPDRHLPCSGVRQPGQPVAEACGQALPVLGPRPDQVSTTPRASLLRLLPCQCCRCCNTAPSACTRQQHAGKLPGRPSTSGVPAAGLIAGRARGRAGTRWATTSGPTWWAPGRTRQRMPLACRRPAPLSRRPALCSTLT